MPVDSQIALGVKPFETESPINAFAKLLQVRQLKKQGDESDMKAQEYQRGIEENNKLSQLLGSQGFDANSAEGQRQLYQQAPSKAGAFIKSQAEGQKFNLDASSKRLELAGQVFGFVRTNPTLENASAAINHLEQNGIWNKQQANQYRQQVAANPGQIAQLADLGFRSALQAKDQLYKSDTRNIGGSTDTMRFDPVTGISQVVNSVRNTQSPDNAASNARMAADAAAGRSVQMRGQDLVDARNRDANLITQNNKPLTEGQSKSALFGSRMGMANKIFDTLEKSGTTTSTPGINSGYGVGSVVNALSSADQQQLMQAKRDFLNAVLRRESGAVIGESEFSNGEKQYFPQIGDDKKTIAQKKSNREAAMRGVLIDVPEGRRAQVVEEITGKPAGPTQKGSFKYLGTE